MTHRAFAEATVGSDYRVGAGDLLRISVFGYPDLAGDVRVSQSGNLTFPMIGNVPVEGLSARQIEKSISQQLATGHFIRESQVTVLVIDYQSHRVAVLGEVAKPGQYPLIGARRVLSLLADAGGVIMATAGDQAIVVHADGTRVSLDLLRMLDGDATQNPMLQSDDTINVPKAPQFYIYGEVQKPGVYRLEHNMTASAAVSAGGGFTRRGSESRIVVKRALKDGKEIQLKIKASDELQPGDVLLVKQSWF